ncbi:MAG: exodeoxyribonuclease I [Wenzhouxiangella sp.]|nr:MAG: exodeoxyribonuclease I [Wenzhouxiangella sp.]
MNDNANTFLWHDYETFGADTRRDRPAQFAALRTDAGLVPIGDPAVFYCQPADDMLPQPDACLITGITPQLARDQGLPENEFAARIHDLMSEPGTCSVGYNNFRFDDEVTRFLFWRNFFEPYTREYSNGNSRFDLIDLMRMTCALRPEGLNWPRREDGSPSFRLEDLAAANGMDTSRAHDALADVEATLGLARLVRQHQPRLWDWALRLRQKHVVAALLSRGEPLLHSSSRLPASHCATAPVLPLAPHPDFAGQWIVWNLNVDPAPFMTRSEEELADLMWTPTADLPEGAERLPIKLVRSNRCPMLSPLTVLDDDSRKRLGIDIDSMQAHAALLRQAGAFTERLARLFSATGPADADPELALYGSFVPRADQALLARVRSLDSTALSRLGQPFQDDRLNELLFRYRARLYPDSLAADERDLWQQWRQRRLIDDPDLASIRWSEYQIRINELRQTQPDRTRLLTDLLDWARLLGLSAATPDRLSTT